MKKHMYIILAVAIVMAAVFGCSKEETAKQELPVETSAPSGSPENMLPEITPEPEHGEAEAYSIVTKTLYYPEEANAETAEFTLVYSLPEFAEANGYSKALNAAVMNFEDELLWRVNEERLPYADGEGAYTHAEADVISARGYYSIVVTERTSFDGSAEETIVKTLVLTETGEIASLASVTGNYEAESVASQQVFNEIDADREHYFGDITIEDVPQAIDAYSGFAVEADGVTVYAAPGTLAPEENGILKFDIPWRAFYPEIVGDVMDESEYEALVGPINDIAAACAMDYSGFDNGLPSGYVAAAFMTRKLTTGREEQRSISVPAGEYEALYGSYFDSEMPDISDSSDGTSKDGDSYSVPVYPRAEFGFRMDDAVRTDDGFVIYGMILFGGPGTSAAGELCPATVVVDGKNVAESFVFRSVELR